MTDTDHRTRPELVFWFDSPPCPGAGAFAHVAKTWGKPVHYFCVDRLSESRRASGWGDCDHGGALITILSEHPDSHRFIGEFLQEHPNAIHVCNGLRSRTTVYLERCLAPGSGARIALWSERPGVYGTRMQKVLRMASHPIVHRYYAWRYRSQVQVFLPLGTRGVETFARYGWNHDILFPFMYAPSLPAIATHLNSRDEQPMLRMLYVGRFGKSTKGVDVLIAAVSQLSGDNWQLDMVGGYGDLKELTIKWAKEHPNVSFCGSWPSNEICQRMATYDVCIVPSRFDGWNVVVNEALHAGIGVITTDQAVSDELVRTSHAGTVVPAGDVTALRNAIQHVIDDPDTVEQWKNNALAYSSRILPQNVGQFLMDVLDYVFVDRDLPRPKCPWL